MNGILRFASVGLVVPVLFGCSSSTPAPGASAPSADAMSTPSGQSAPSAASTPAGGAATTGGPLILGTLLAATGPVASYALPEFAGMGADVDAVNAAGGVLGMPVQTINGDSGNTQAVASLSLERSVDKGAQVIIGATTSTMSLSVIDQAVAAGVLLFSPANTAVKLSDPAITQGLYFRTAPPDSYEGSVLARLAFDEGKRSVAIMQIDDAYGAELADSFTLAFKELNGRVVAREVYNPAASSFADNVAKVKAAKPDAIVLLGLSESTTVIGDLIEAGIGPQDVTLYLCDGNMDNSLADGLPAGALEGVKGTIPGALADRQMQASFLAVNPSLTNFVFAPETYDAVVITALAAEAAGSVAPADIAAQIPLVTAIGNTACTTFAECLNLLKAGKAISYRGPSRARALLPNGDPSVAAMGIWQFGADDQIAPVDEVDGDVPRASLA